MANPLIFKKNCLWLLPALVALALAGCAGSPSPKSTAAPLWVTNAAGAYPNSEWLCVVESAADKKSAESAALSGLAQVFRVDLNSVTNANRQFAQAIGNAKGKKVAISSESKDFAQELVSTSAVSGLIGVITESWAARDGTVFANARMNRRECAARYAAMIHENEKVIRQAKEEAARNPQTFEAFELLGFAVNIAQATDNFYLLLTVLDPSAISKRPEYGNAEAVRSLAQNAARSIVVTVQVDGDEGERIAKAFGKYFTERGFRTASGGSNPYQLSAVFGLEDLELDKSRNKFVRYILICSVKNKEGVEVFSLSENGREGHLTYAEAKQRAFRVAETSIGSTGFTMKFDAYLASLLQ